MSDLKIFRVLGDRETAREGVFAELGLTDLAENFLAVEVSRVSKLGQQACQAFVPVRYAELRKSIVRIKEDRFTHSVKVPETTHVDHSSGIGKDVRRLTGKVGVSISNALLADYLNNGGNERVGKYAISGGEKVLASDVFKRIGGAGQEPGEERETQSNGNYTRSQDALTAGPFVGPRRKQDTAGWIEGAQDALVEVLGEDG